MSQLRLSLLGPFEATLDDRPIGVFGTDKTRALLAYLAVEAGRPHRREFLAGLLWGDQPEQRALHSLRQALSALRLVLSLPKEGPGRRRPVRPFPADDGRCGAAQPGQ
jgi:DNA-binding SARP family transcriptional activator